MPIKPKEKELDFNNLFENLVKDVSDRLDAETGVDLNIVEFVEQELDLGIELAPRQTLLLKVAYGLELTEEEESILEYWAAIGRCHWHGRKEYQILVMEVGRRAGKCKGSNSLTFYQSQGMLYEYEILNELMGISRDSYITTAEGLQSLVEERNLLEASIPFKQTIAIEGKGRKAETGNFFIKGVTPTKRVITSAGYNLEGTPEHRIKVLDSNGNIIWRYLADIQVGEYVCIHRSANLFAEEEIKLDDYLPLDKDFARNARPVRVENTSLDADWGYLIGLMTANGTWSDRSGLSCHHHLQDKDDYAAAFEKVLSPLGLNFFVRQKITSDNGGQTAVSSVILRSIFDKLGFVVDSRVNNKVTPWAIRQSPKHVQAAYLSGLFDGDGSVEKGGKAITFSTASKKMAVETQLLLLNFGVVSRFGEVYVNGRPYYKFSLRGQRSVRRFVEEIGFKLKRKQNKVLANLDNVSRDGGDTERIPNQIDWLKRLRAVLPDNTGKQPGSIAALYESRGLSAPVVEPSENVRQKFRSIVGNSIKQGAGENLSSYRLPALLALAEEHCRGDREAVKHFRYLADCDYFYDPVVSVEDSEAFCTDLTVPGHEQYVAQGMTNHNTTISSIIAAYEFYKLCKLASPQKFFGISKSSAIAILVLATTAEQAKRSIFASVTGVVQNCGYFKRLEEQGKLFIQKESIEYPEKAVGIYSGNSQSASQVGSNVLVLIMDEVARFKDSDGKSNAITLWSNIGISTAVFGTHAKRLAISSAWFQGDAIEELYQNSELDETAFGLQARSWDLNPVKAARDSPVIASEYIADPIRAALEFEGLRRATEDPFLDEKEIARAFRGECVIDALPYIKELDPSELQLATDATKQKKFVALEIVRLDQAPVGTHGVLHLDPAINTDSYGLAFGHNEFTSEGDQIVIIDGLLAWEPLLEADVSIVDVQKAAIAIHRKRPLASITADHYASPETIQRFQEIGLNAQVEFFSNNLQVQMYTLVRSLLHEDRLVLPAGSRWKPLLYRELSRLSLIRQNKIDHPKGVGNSKDLADCVATVCWKLAERVVLDRAISVPTVISRPGAHNPLVNPNSLPPPTPFRSKLADSASTNGMQNWRNYRQAGGRLR